MPVRQPCEARTCLRGARQAAHLENCLFSARKCLPYAALLARLPASSCRARASVQKRCTSQPLLRPHLRLAGAFHRRAVHTSCTLFAHGDQRRALSVEGQVSRQATSSRRRAACKMRGLWRPPPAVVSPSLVTPGAAVHRGCVALRQLLQCCRRVAPCSDAPRAALIRQTQWVALFAPSARARAASSARTRTTGKARRSCAAWCVPGRRRRGRAGAWPKPIRV